VKGAVLSIAPSAVLVDLTHAVPPQDIAAGAYLLWACVEVFPPGTIHVAVVDPGVGSVRLALAIRCRRGDVFVGPDNGLLMPAVERLGGVELTVELNRAEFWRPNTSRTFHGRDIFGPAAAHLTTGVALEALGSPVSDLVQFAFPRPHGRRGEVIHVDTYGNLVTNFRAADLPQNFRVRLGSLAIPHKAFYAAVAPGELLALVGSAGLLEISARDADAAALTVARRGTPVQLEPV
jgi:S-adenosyl-L-methionine hydrolase (adenosine-forming)